MGVKLATTSTFHQWRTHPMVHHSSNLASSSISRRSLSTGSWMNLKHIKSCELLKPSRTSLIRRAFNSNLDPFSEEEFAQKMQELSLKFHVSNNESDDPLKRSYSVEEPWLEMSNIESIDLPLSLRIIKRKLQMEEEEEEEEAHSAIKKAFSSMVFMIRELQSFTLHLRELLLFEDLQGILHRVRNEMQASFVWLFQQVFSTTPTLMVSVMILLANFTAYSIGNNNSAFAAVVTNPPPPITTVSFKFDATEISEIQKLDSSMIKTFSVSFNGGDGGGGNNLPALKSGTDGDGSDKIRIQTQFSSPEGETSADSDACVSRQEEIRLWNSILEESMGVLDHETMKNLVSPVEARLEGEESIDQFKTELLYQTGLFQEPENVLLLANYAQFLYLIVNDYDRAEKYFKRAAKAEPRDAEALNKYATFLWKARNDIWRAEETYLEAISTDPINSVYAANYAHFLWNTDGDDICFPLDASSQQNIT